MNTNERNYLKKDDGPKPTIFSEGVSLVQNNNYASSNNSPN